MNRLILMRTFCRIHAEITSYHIEIAKTGWFREAVLLIVALK